MRIQLCQGCNNRSISHTGYIYGIDIVLLNLLQDKIQFAPTIIVTVKLLLFPCLGE